MKDQIIDRFIKKTEKIKRYLKTIYLFGSRAREEEKPYSDYDLLLVMDKRVESIVDKLHDAAVEILLETGKVISLKIFEKKEFKRLASIPTPFMSRILKEGIKIG